MKPLSLRWQQVEALERDGHTYRGFWKHEAPAIGDAFAVEDTRMVVRVTQVSVPLDAEAHAVTVRLELV